MNSFPRFSFTVKGGYFKGGVITHKIFPILDTIDYSSKYMVKPSFQGGLEAIVNFWGNFSVAAEANLRIQTLTHQVPYLDNASFHYLEKNLSGYFPLTLGYNFPRGTGFSAKIYSGIGVAMFMEASYSYFYTVEGEITEQNAYLLNRKKENITVLPGERNKFRLMALGGIRVNYQLEKFHIFSDLRVSKELSLYNIPEYRFDNPDLFFSNNYVLSDISFNYMDISLGITYNFSYKVKPKY
jgi:hypothetical protein